jgi:hypothetical protein
MKLARGFPTKRQGIGDRTEVDRRDARREDTDGKSGLVVFGGHTSRAPKSSEVEVELVLRETEPDWRSGVWVGCFRMGTLRSTLHPLPTTPSQGHRK